MASHSKDARDLRRGPRRFQGETGRDGRKAGPVCLLAEFPAKVAVPPHLRTDTRVRPADLLRKERADIQKGDAEGRAAAATFLGIIREGCADYYIERQTMPR